MRELISVKGAQLLLAEKFSRTARCRHILPSYEFNLKTFPCSCHLKIALFTKFQRAEIFSRKTIVSSSLWCKYRVKKEAEKGNFNKILKSYIMLFMTFALISHSLFYCARLVCVECRRWQSSK